MCGIIAVVRRRAERAAPTSTHLLELLEPVPQLLDAVTLEPLTLEPFTLEPFTLEPFTLEQSVLRASERVSQVDRLLRGVPGVLALVADRSLVTRLENTVSGLESQVLELERRLDHDAASAGSDLEATNAAVVRLKDALWAVHYDRLRTARAVDDLAGPDA